MGFNGRFLRGKWGGFSGGLPDNKVRDFLDGFMNCYRHDARKVKAGALGQNYNSASGEAFDSAPPSRGAWDFARQYVALFGVGGASDDSAVLDQIQQFKKMTQEDFAYKILSKVRDDDRFASADIYGLIKTSEAPYAPEERVYGRAGPWEKDRKALLKVWGAVKERGDVPVNAIYASAKEIWRPPER